MQKVFRIQGWQRTRAVNMINAKRLVGVCGSKVRTLDSCATAMLLAAARFTFAYCQRANEK